ncbi:hypothetical protein CRYUN_Cryun15aG0053700 [Craigia yunnanensis]
MGGCPSEPGSGTHNMEGPLDDIGVYAFRLWEHAMGSSVRIVGSSQLCPYIGMQAVCI